MRVAEVVGGGLRAVVVVVATGGTVVAEVVVPGAFEVGVVSVGKTVDVTGDAVVVASDVDVVGLAVLRVGELGLVELHPAETSAAVSRAAEAMRLTMRTSIRIRLTEGQHRMQLPDVDGGTTTAVRAPDRRISRRRRQSGRFGHRRRCAISIGTSSDVRW